jgi:hypothetical protein
LLPPECQLVRRGVFVPYQPFSGDEIVEHILLLAQHSRFVPFFAELSSAAKVCYNIESALFHPPGN